MSVRGITRSAQWSEIARQACLIRQSNGSNLWSWSYTTLGTKDWARGAKTKTTIKASSLPQGVLPPLPKLQDDTPEKSYPKVLQQHLNNVRKFKDCIVLTRVGDFYEMYFDQVNEYAHLVNLKKAKRATQLGDVAMAGFQHTQLGRYLKTFVQDLGKQVAISEQVQLPDDERLTGGNSHKFDRRVTRVITAGTLIDEDFMDPYENNYLLSVHVEGVAPAALEKTLHPSLQQSFKRMAKVGLSWVDLSSGAFFTQASDLATLPSLVTRIVPREVVLEAPMECLSQSTLQKLLGDSNLAVHFQAMPSKAPSLSDWTSVLERPVSESDKDTFTAAEIAAGNLVLKYIGEKLFETNLKLQPPVQRSDDETMAIDRQSLRGLEIRTTQRDGLFQGSLLHAVRRTVTKSGSRLLSQRLVSPSMSLSVIDHRLNLVQELLNHDALREDVTALLQNTSDTFRLLQRFSIGKGDADDMLGLAKTIELMQKISDSLHDHILARQDEDTDAQATDGGVSLADQTHLWDVLGRFDLESPVKVARTIHATINEESLSHRHAAEQEQAEEAEEMTEEVISADEAGEKTPKLARRASRRPTNASSTDFSTEDIWIMRRGASPTLERGHGDLEKLLSAKEELATTLRQQLQARSLTLKWSAQLGHFCHLKNKDTRVSTAQLTGSRNIGSTKSARSFYLADWTHLGVRIDDAKLRIRTEEERVFNKLRGNVLENLMKLRRNAAVLDELDVACSSATVAKERELIRPLLHDGTSHKIIGGRHPTVDVGLKEQGKLFTSNDCLVGGGEKVYLITGPNMAGKSTYLRQNALITILAQTGCFVPADYAEIGLVDKIFSRVGSADNLYQDQSTFMIEMLETAEILKQATPRSFVIMDEVGRGTTPEDGVAVGYACLHHLHNVNQSRTLFATHFHALADMTRDFDSLACYCTDVAEEVDGSWAYVHKLRRGVNRRSHALKVARLAGLPEQAITVAGEVLTSLNRGSEHNQYQTLFNQQSPPQLEAAAG